MPKNSFLKNKWIALAVVGGGILVLCLLTLVVAFGVLYNKNRPKDNDAANPSISLLGKYTRAAVAADNVYCSEIGRDTLLKGGNAVDAAIATLFCIGIMDAHSTGIGGGHFMTIYNATTKTCSVVDAREVAPLAATKEMFVNKSGLAQKGWLAIAVTGEIHGYWTEYKRFGGGVPWAQLVQPTIDLLREGYPTSYALAATLKDWEDYIINEPTMAPFINPTTGKVYQQGEQITTRGKLANFLQQIAESDDPIQMMYNSAITEKIAQEILDNGGIITVEDFHKYASKVYEGDDVIFSDLSGNRRSCGPPPPSGSALTQSIIKSMDSYFAEKNSNEHNFVEIFHHFIETAKFVYGVRSNMSDRAFNPHAFPMAKNITTDAFIKYIRSLITDKTHDDAYYGGNFVNSSDHGTSNIGVIDALGNAVSVTSTINTDFGAGVISDSTGILWNDEMDDFSTPGFSNYFGFAPSEANFIEPGKRPMSSASPTIIFNLNDAQDILVVGTAGGSKIITGTSSVAYRALWLNENVKQAIDAVRIHNQLTPNIVYYEDGFKEKYKKGLEKKGHTLELAHNLSIVTAVRRSVDGCTYANSDYRKGTESDPAGY